MRKRGWFGVEKFERSFERKDGRRESIDDVYCSKCIFSPKLNGKVSMKF